MIKMGGMVWGMAIGGLIAMPIKYYKTDDIFYLKLTLGYVLLTAFVGVAEYLLHKRDKKKKEDSNGTLG